MAAGWTATCLLELETILEYKLGIGFEAVLVELSADNKNWKPSKAPRKQFLDGAKEKLTIWHYDAKTKALSSSGSKVSSKWHLVELPTGFHIFDAVLVSVEGESIKAFGVQITVSPTPFAKHLTHETCSESSKKNISALQGALEEKFKKRVDIVYVMVAPQTKKPADCAAHGHLAPYYFAPPAAVGEGF
jgi:hypothetical protein